MPAGGSAAAVLCPCPCRVLRGRGRGGAGLGGPVRGGVPAAGSGACKQRAGGPVLTGWVRHGCTRVHVVRVIRHRPCACTRPDVQPARRTISTTTCGRRRTCFRARACAACTCPARESCLHAHTQHTRRCRARWVLRYCTASQALAELRLTLRQRMAASALCDAPHFVQQLEGVYRGLWRRCVAHHHMYSDSDSAMCKSLWPTVAVCMAGASACCMIAACWLSSSAPPHPSPGPLCLCGPFPNALQARC